ncbi:unnamed protein product, partial [marine sediment metagenome]
LKSGPAKLPRRLVAVGDRVYVTLGYEEPISILDAATGKTLQVLDGSQGSEGLLVSQDVLFANVIEDLQTAVFKPEHPYCWTEAARARKIGQWKQGEGKQFIKAFNIKTGDLLWEKKTPVAPLSLAADHECVYFCNGLKVVCLMRQNGSHRWESEPVPQSVLFGSDRAPTLVVYGDTVLYSANASHIMALDAHSGQTLWSTKHRRSGHCSPGDVLVVNDLVWSGGDKKSSFVGKDLRTGEVKTQFDPPEMTWFHPRCHISKATDRYLLPSRTGIEFADVRAQTVEMHHWAR